MNIERFLKTNLVPDILIRLGIRKLLAQRLIDETLPSAEEQQEHFMQLVEKLKASPIAVNTPEANEQHYEVPAQFYQAVLGENLKYSCGFWDTDTITLNNAEERMLQLTIERAGIVNGEHILELGCGWGSLTLFMARKFPSCRITAVSNSTSQKTFIEKKAAERGLKNITVITADMNDFEIDSRFDRVVSVEMFEHMRNYSKLFDKVSRFLKPGGEIFIHIFCNKQFSYLFEPKDDTDWMSRYFFTGGIMPSNTLLLYFSNGFDLKQQWVVNGTHYKKTANAWLANMDRNKRSILPLFEKVYGKKEKLMWWIYWRVFFMSCAELWGFDRGNEWFVSHYLFKKKQ